MSRISDKFAALKAKGEKALVAYIAAGDPSLEATSALISALESAGTDLIELGLAFSDPLADGPTIQAGSQRALAAGATADNVLAMVAEVRRAGVAIPLLIMTYYNLLVRPGVENFCRRAKAAGIDGLIIPDVPMEEADELLEATRAAGLDLIQFVAPTSTPDRIEKLARLAGGFVYCVSLTGVTGERTALPARFREIVAETKRNTETPVCVGFGISRPEQVREICAIADGVIVGSALVRLCGEGSPLPELVARVGAYARELKAATK
ncbi:MAG TPA: tryptophan synthase subunit alpha [Symbiobacteriaceae bacterium]|nr:tryptophan synthase subunit alpha [Symbiobacteriaceae bacterium]